MKEKKKPGPPKGFRKGIKKADVRPQMEKEAAEAAMPIVRGFHPVQVWKCILSIADGVVQGHPSALIPQHASAMGNTYMVKLSDDGREIVVTQDLGRHERDSCSFIISQLEDRLAQLSVGEHPKLVNEESRWHDRLVELGLDRLNEAAEIRKKIDELKEQMRRAPGIRVERIPVSQFRDRVFTIEFA